MFSKNVIMALRKIPKGKVTTYSELARFAGSPKACRAIGNIMNRNKEPEKYPCYKVVRADGRVGGYAKGQEKKISLLRADGIEITDGKIDLKKHMHKLV